MNNSNNNKYNLDINSNVKSIKNSNNVNLNTLHNNNIIAKIEDLSLLKKLGEGSFGEVFLTIKDNFPNMYFATKKVNNNVAFDEKNRKYFNNELYILRTLNHENIIKLYEIKRSSNNFYLVFEYCNGGTLNNILKKYLNKFNRTFMEKECRVLIKQIVNGIYYLQRQKIIHRDLKLDNIMIHFKNEEDLINLNLINCCVKIIDFGFAKFLEHNNLAKSILGSPLNMDPILLGGILDKNQITTYDEKADLWSLGTICYNILVGYPPFQTNNYKELINLIKIGDYFIPLSLNLSKQSLSFLVHLLQEDSSKRNDIKFLSHHEFIAGNYLENNDKMEYIDHKNVPNKFLNNGFIRLNVHIKVYPFLENQSYYNHENQTNITSSISENTNNQENNKNITNFLYTYNRFNENKNIGHELILANNEKKLNDNKFNNDISRKNNNDTLKFSSFKINPITNNEENIDDNININNNFKTPGNIDDIKFDLNKNNNQIIKIRACKLFDKLNKDLYKLESIIYPCYIYSDKYLTNLKDI